MFISGFKTAEKENYASATPQINLQFTFNCVRHGAWQWLGAKSRVTWTEKFDLFLK